MPGSVRIILLVSLLISLLLGIISMGVNGLWGNSLLTDNQKTAQAFLVIGAFLLIAALVMLLILFFTCADKSNLFMIIITILTAIAVLSYIISTATAYAPSSPGYGSWCLAALWSTIIALIVAIIFVVKGE